MMWVSRERQFQTLLGSVTSREKGHNFWDQLKVLKDTYKKPLVLIEGQIIWEDRMIIRYNLWNS